VEITKKIITKRLSKARELMAAEDLDAYLLIGRANKYYYSGFDHGVADDHTTSFVLLTKHESYFGLNKMDQTAADEHCKCCRVITTEGRSDGIGTLLGKIAKRTGIPKQIGYEQYALKYNDFLGIEDHLPATKLIISEIADRQRTIKSDDEIASIEAAMDIADQVLDSVSAQISEQLTEKEIAWMLESKARELGADSLSFPAIVATGRNSAKPHHVPTDKAIESGDFVMIDFGVSYEGYCSDTTRTYIMGGASARHKKIYSAVLDALNESKEKARAGMGAGELDEIARKVIEKHGFSDEFSHSLGHGLGLDIHELPWVAPKEMATLKEGMVFTIEPGVYVEGLGGVRIEDSVVLEKNGARSLTKLNRELICL